MVRHSVFFRASPTTTTNTMLITYIANTTLPALSGKKVEAIMTYTASRAEHEVNGTRSAVRIRCLESGSTRVALMAGTLHPKPTISGRNARPGRPMNRIVRSVTTAARAM